MSPERRQWLWIGWWALLVALGSVAITRELRIDSDLRLFLPAADTPQERILLDELKEGPGTRALLVALSGADSARLATVSEQLASRLRANAAFARVENGTLPSALQVDDLLFRYRYLLSPRPQGCACDGDSLREALNQRLIELGSPAGAVAQEWLLRDPSGEVQAMLDNWLPAAEPQLLDGVWFSRDGRQALLFLQTAAAGFDADRQRQALSTLNEALHDIDPAGAITLGITGPGAFTALLEQSVRRDITLLGALAGTGSVLFLLLVLRSLRHTVLGVLSLATTSLVALASVVWLFPSVHGITLAFGFTLLGVAMDYPVHLMLHLDRQRDARQTLRTLWPTLRLSIATTCIAYLALALTGFAGLAQLGAFTVCGLLATGAVVRWVLPHLVAPRQSQPLPRWLARVEHWPRFALSPLLLLGLSMGALWFSPRPLWSNDLAALTPVPQDLQDLDARLRAELGAPDLRYVLAVRGRDAEAVLQRDESLRMDLDGLVGDAVIGGYDSPSRLLPSLARQRTTQQQLPTDEQLRTSLQGALENSPFQQDAFNGFIADVAASRSLRPLDSAALAGTALAARLEAVLLEKPGETIGMVTLSDVRQPERLAAWAEAQGDAVLLLDLKSIAENLVARYRALALSALAIALLVIAALMLVQLRWRATLAVLLPVLATLAATVCVLHLLGVQLSLFHVVALLLVGGLSFDYGLFFNRREDVGEHALRTRYSVMVCWVSTLGAFALLTLSQVPVLRAIGSTVALGVTFGFVLALLARGRGVTRAS